jgi:hypothetical protein
LKRNVKLLFFCSEPAKITIMATDGKCGHCDKVFKRKPIMKSDYEMQLELAESFNRSTNDRRNRIISNFAILGGVLCLATAAGIALTITPLLAVAGPVAGFALTGAAFFIGSYAIRPRRRGATLG